MAHVTRGLCSAEDHWRVVDDMAAGLLQHLCPPPNQQSSDRSNSADDTSVDCVPASCVCFSMSVDVLPIVRDVTRIVLSESKSVDGLYLSVSSATQSEHGDLDAVSSACVSAEPGSGSLRWIYGGDSSGPQQRVILPVLPGVVVGHVHEWVLDALERTYREFVTTVSPAGSSSPAVATVFTLSWGNCEATSPSSNGDVDSGLKSVPFATTAVVRRCDLHFIHLHPELWPRAEIFFPLPETGRHSAAFWAPLRALLRSRTRSVLVFAIAAAPSLVNLHAVYEELQRVVECAEDPAIPHVEARFSPLLGRGAGTAAQRRLSFLSVIASVCQREIDWLHIQLGIRSAEPLATGSTAGVLSPPPKDPNAAAASAAAETPNTASVNPRLLLSTSPEMLVLQQELVTHHHRQHHDNSPPTGGARGTSDREAPCEEKSLSNATYFVSYSAATAEVPQNALASADVVGAAVAAADKATADHDAATVTMRPKSVFDRLVAPTTGTLHRTTVSSSPRPFVAGGSARHTAAPALSSNGSQPIKAQLAMERQRCDDLQDEVQRLRRQLHAFEHAAASGGAHAAAAGAGAATSASDEQAMHDRLRSMEAAFESTVKDMTRSFEAKMVANESELARLRTRVQQAEEVKNSDETNARDEVARCQEQLRQAQDRLRVSEERLKSNATERSRLEGMLEDLRREVKQLREMNGRATAKLEADALHHKDEQLRQQENRFRMTKSALEGQIAKLSAELQDALVDKQNLVASLKAVRAAMKLQLEEVAPPSESASGDAQARYQKQTEEARQLLDAITAERDGLKRALAERDEQLLTLRSAVQVMQTTRPLAHQKVDIGAVPPPVLPSRTAPSRSPTVKRGVLSTTPATRPGMAHYVAAEKSA